MSELKAGEVMLEVSPPALRASQETVSKAVDKVASAVRRLAGRVDYLNVPEIIVENRDGMPLYRNMDAREFGARLQKRTSRPSVVNKVVVFVDSPAEFEEWARQTTNDYRISRVVLVGGSSPDAKYPGPTVLHANELASKLDGAVVGNIAIPERENEEERMLTKTGAGCSFFTTQVILQAEGVNALLEGYARGCESSGVQPACFFLSFAPIGDLQDLNFLKWLGAKVPEEAEERLKKSSGMGGESIEIASEVLADVLRYTKGKTPSVPICLNVEPVSMHNLELAEEMLLQLSSQMRKDYGLAIDHNSSNILR